MRIVIRTITMIALFVIMVMVISACGDPTNPESDDPVGHTQVFTVDTPQGPITCISWKEGYGGGLSCDWRNDEVGTSTAGG